MLTTVARFTTVGEAESARSALDAAGIDVEVADENIVAVDWLSSNAVGGIKLRVREDDSENASLVLATAAAEAAADVAVTEAVVPSSSAVIAALLCPACGSAEIVRVPRMKIFVALAVIVVGVGAAVEEPMLALIGTLVAGVITALTPSHRCNECAERWSAMDVIERDVHAPPPNPSDTIERQCPRCGSTEFYPIEYRRLKALGLLFSLAWIAIVPVWVVLPKGKCDACGKRTWTF